MGSAATTKSDGEGMFHTTLRRLEVFVSAVEAGGFRACSDRLEISQAAVSNHVKQLETELGYRLFLRRRGSVAGVTEKGVTAYRRAKELLAEADRLGDAPAPTKRRLKIQSDAVLDTVLADRITDYMVGEPGLEIDLQQSYFERIVDGFGRGELDLAYFYSDGPPAELASSFCWFEPVSLCARLDHPIHARGVLDLREACSYPMVAAPAGSHFRRSVDSLLKRAGADRYAIALEVNHAHVARDAVIKGLAASMVITRYLDTELARFGVAAVPLRGPELALEVRRAVRRPLQIDPAVGRFTEYLEQGSAPAGPDRAIPAPLAQVAVG